jgi:hypothetical protein
MMMMKMLHKRSLLSWYSYGAATSSQSTAVASSYSHHMHSLSTTVIPSFQLLHWRCNLNSPCRRNPIISHRGMPLFSTYNDVLSFYQRRSRSKSMFSATKNGEAVDDNNNSFSPSDDIIESTSLAWITKVVIGYNLCPFAERPLRENKLNISVVRGSSDHTVAAAVTYELLARSDESQHGTTSVVVAPEYHPTDFNAYLSLIQFIEDGLMEKHDLHGVVQIAPFHPQFEFEGSGSDGIDNYTNRSPFPMFHIIREDDVSKAVDKMGGDASKVWRRNISLMQTMEERLGREGAVRAMKGEESVDDMDGLLRELKLSGYRVEEN